MIVRLLRGVFVFLDEKLVRDEFSQFGFDHILHCVLSQHTFSAHTTECNDDLVAFNVYQLNVAAVCPQCGANLLIYCLLNQLYLVNICQSAGPSRCCFKDLSCFVTLNFFEDFFDFALAAAAAASGLAVIRYIFYCCQIVFAYYPLDFILGDAEAVTYDASFELVFFFAYG